MSVPICFLDVFAEKPLEGNQLAVVFDAGDLSSEQMQAIAKETNFSETTFLISRETRNGGYNVRIFTPDTELPFAGHPTLGTAYAIRRFLIEENVEELRLNLNVGQIPIRFIDDNEGVFAWMRQKEPEFGAFLNRGEVAKALSLSDSDLDSDFGPRVVSTGVPTIIVPLNSSDSFIAAKVDEAPYKALLEKTGEALILVYCRGGYDERQELSVRVFCHCFGIIEDPATGAAAGCLAAYLAKEKYFGDSRVEVATGQGYEVGRPSTLYLRSNDDGDSVEIEIGGKIQFVGKGEFVV